MGRADFTAGDAAAEGDVLVGDAAALAAGDALASGAGEADFLARAADAVSGRQKARAATDVITISNLCFIGCVYV